MRKSGNAVWGVAIALAALLALYVGAYYAMVKPAITFGTIPAYAFRDGIRPAYYPPIGPQPTDEWVNRLFAPMHSLDRRIRPRIWDRAAALQDWLREK